MFNGFFTEIDERTFPDVVSNKMHEKHFFKVVVTIFILFLSMLIYVWYSVYLYSLILLDLLLEESSVRTLLPIKDLRTQMLCRGRPP